MRWRSSAEIATCRTDHTAGRQSSAAPHTGRAKVTIAQATPVRRSAVEEEFRSEWPPAPSSSRSLSRAALAVVLTRPPWDFSGPCGTTNLVMGFGGSIAATAGSGIVRNNRVRRRSRRRWRGLARDRWGIMKKHGGDSIFEPNRYYLDGSFPLPPSRSLLCRLRPGRGGRCPPCSLSPLRRHLSPSPLPPLLPRPPRFLCRCGYPSRRCA